jgi:hypothetical protein
VAEWESRLRQTLREQCAETLDYWEKFQRFEKYAQVELGRVEFECQHHGFTLHGIKHARGVEENLARLIPAKLLKREFNPFDQDALAPEEIFILLLATWSHDFGMIDPDKRKIHNKLSRDYIYDSENNKSRVLWCHLESNFAYYVGQLCYAHRDHQLGDGTKADTLSEIEEKDNLGMRGSRIRPRLLAALLRLADELDIGYYRAPEDVMYVTNLPEESANYWVTEELINAVRIDSTRLTISIVPFQAKVKGDPLYEQLVDARCLKIQEELDKMHYVLKNYPSFEYKEVYLGDEPIPNIVLRNSLADHGRSIEIYKKIVREMRTQVEVYDKRFSDLARVAQQLTEVANTCQQLVIQPICQPVDNTDVTSVLVATSDSGKRTRLLQALQPYFEQVIEADSISQVVQTIGEQKCAIIVMELEPDKRETAFGVLASVRNVANKRNSRIQVIMFAPHGQPNVSIEAMKLGAYDCLEYISYDDNFIKKVQVKVSEALEFQVQRIGGSD